MPRIRDHDPRYCARCQFWFAFNRAAGAVVGIVAAVVGLVIGIGGLAAAAFFGFLYLTDHPVDLGPVGAMVKYLAEVFSLILAAFGGIIFLLAAYREVLARNAGDRNKRLQGLGVRFPASTAMPASTKGPLRDPRNRNRLRSLPSGAGRRARGLRRGQERGLLVFSLHKVGRPIHAPRNPIINPELKNAESRGKLKREQIAACQTGPSNVDVAHRDAPAGASDTDALRPRVGGQQQSVSRRRSQRAAATHHRTPQ